MGGRQLKLVPVGPAGAEETARIAVEGAKARGIRHLVVASSSGATAELFRDCGLQVTVVTLAYGSKEPGKNVMEEAERQKLKDWGFSVCTAAHALSAAERAISGAAGGMYPLEIVANTLRMFSQGTKVCVECSAMAMDGDYLPFGEDVVAVGGTSLGCDTALVLRPSYSSKLFATKVKEVLCLPGKERE